MPPVYTLCNIYVPLYGNLRYLDTYTYLPKYTLWVLCLNRHFGGGAESYSKEPSKLSISAVARVLTKRFSVSLCNSQYLLYSFHPTLIHTARILPSFLTLSMLPFYAIFWLQCVVKYCSNMCGFPKSTQAKAHKRTCRFFCTVSKSECCIWKYCPTKLKYTHTIVMASEGGMKFF